MLIGAAVTTEGLTGQRSFCGSVDAAGYAILPHRTKCAVLGASVVESSHAIALLNAVQSSPSDWLQSLAIKEQFQLGKLVQRVGKVRNHTICSAERDASIQVTHCGQAVDPLEPP